MLVREAMEIARHWVREHAEPHPHFRGAFFSGSILDQPDDAPLPTPSDVDVVVVLAQVTGEEARTKFRLNGVLIEVTYLAAHELDDVQQVARTFYLAHSFCRAAIIADPTGHLHRLHNAIAPTFAEPLQILVRCNDVFDKMYHRLIAFDVSRDDILGWLFPTSLSAVAIIVAGQMNPTVRTRYRVAQNVLYSRGMTSAYEDLLELLGCREVTRPLVQHHLNCVAQIFDQAANLNRKDFPFSCDITTGARRLAIDGSQQLIDAGHHREAVFWIVATHARCVQILHAAGVPPMGSPLTAILSDLLRIDERGGLEQLRNRALSYIPTLRGLVRSIVHSTEI
jgi:hypothetical protein